MERSGRLPQVGYDGPGVPKSSPDEREVVLSDVLCACLHCSCAWALLASQPAWHLSLCREVRGNVLSEVLSSVVLWGPWVLRAHRGPFLAVPNQGLLRP